MKLFNTFVVISGAYGAGAYGGGSGSIALARTSK